MRFHRCRHAGPVRLRKSENGKVTANSTGRLCNRRLFQPRFFHRSQRSKRRFLNPSSFTSLPSVKTLNLGGATEGCFNRRYNIRINTSEKLSAADPLASLHEQVTSLRASSSRSVQQAPFSGPGFSTEGNEGHEGF